MNHLLEERETTYHVCQVCGYVADGVLPEICPVCGAGKEKFRPFADDVRRSRRRTSSAYRDRQGLQGVEISG